MSRRDEKAEQWNERNENNQITTKKQRILIKERPVYVNDIDEYKRAKR